MAFSFLKKFPLIGEIVSTVRDSVRGYFDGSNQTIHTVFGDSESEAPPPRVAAPLRKQTSRSVQREKVSTARPPENTFPFVDPDTGAAGKIRFGIDHAGRLTDVTIALNPPHAHYQERAARFDGARAHSKVDTFIYAISTTLEEAGFQPETSTPLVGSVGSTLTLSAPVAMREAAPVLLALARENPLFSSLALKQHDHLAIANAIGHADGSTFEDVLKHHAFHYEALKEEYATAAKYKPAKLVPGYLHRMNNPAPLVESQGHGVNAPLPLPVVNPHDIPSVLDLTSTAPAMTLAASEATDAPLSERIRTLVAQLYAPRAGAATPEAKDILRVVMGEVEALPLEGKNALLVNAAFAVQDLMRGNGAYAEATCHLLVDTFETMMLNASGLVNNTETLDVKKMLLAAEMDTRFGARSGVAATMLESLQVAADTAVEAMQAKTRQPSAPLGGADRFQAYVTQNSNAARSVAARA